MSISINVYIYLSIYIYIHITHLVDGGCHGLGQNVVNQPQYVHICIYRERHIHIYIYIYIYIYISRTWLTAGATAWAKMSLISASATCNIYPSIYLSIYIHTC